MACNTERAMNNKEIVSTSEQHCTSKSHIYLFSKVGIVNLDIARQVKNTANKFADSMATEVNYHKLVASVPKISRKFRKSVSTLPQNAHLSDDRVRATSTKFRMLQGIGVSLNLRFFSVRIVTADNNIYFLVMKQGCKSERIILLLGSRL